MPRIGYARVSTIDQDLDVQLAKLKAEGCAIVRSEKVSGGSREGRAELATILEFLRPGDELVVTRLDRLGRDTRDVLNLIYEAEQRGAFVTVLEADAREADMLHATNVGRTEGFWDFSKAAIRRPSADFRSGRKAAVGTWQCRANQGASTSFGLDGSRMAAAQ